MTRTDEGIQSHTSHVMISLRQLENVIERKATSHFLSGQKSEILGSFTFKTAFQLQQSLPGLLRNKPLCREQQVDRRKTEQDVLSYSSSKELERV